MKLSYDASTKQNQILSIILATEPKVAAE